MGRQHRLEAVGSRPGLGQGRQQRLHPVRGVAGRGLDPELLERDSEEQEGQFLLEVSYSDRIPDDVLCLLEETAPRRRLLSSVG